MKLKNLALAFVLLVALALPALAAKVLGSDAVTVRELRDDLFRAAARHLPGVERLQRAASRARTVDRVDAVAASVQGNFSSRLCISMAASAASSPLLPWLPPARAWASSKRSAASTPLSTGTR